MDDLHEIGEMFDALDGYDRAELDVARWFAFRVERERERGRERAEVARLPIFRARFDGELVVDNFAGGGGASRA